MMSSVVTTEEWSLLTPALKRDDPAPRTLEQIIMSPNMSSAADFAGCGFSRSMGMSLSAVARFRW